MKHCVGGGVTAEEVGADDEEEELDVLETVCAMTLNCICWAAVRLPLCAVT